MVMLGHRLHLPNIEMKSPQLIAKVYMKGQSDIPLILGRPRPSKQLTSTQMLSQYAIMRGAHQFL